MKKIITSILTILFLCTPIVQASHHHSRCAHHYRGSHSSSSTPYIVSRDYKTTEQRFSNCDKHYAITETITYFYNDGRRVVYNNSTIYKKDGTLIQENCLSVKHLIYENKHYFIVRQPNRGYKVINEDGEALTTKIYSGMNEIIPNRLLVKYKKKYGIIDLNENIVAPIKYQKVFRVEETVYITKLNGYYGVLDAEGNVLIKNEYDKIKLINDSLMLKKYGKYGIADTYGKILFDTEYDKIKKLGEYILLKKDNQYIALDSDGTRLSDFKYKKIKLERNSLKGLTKDNTWDNI